MNMKTPFIVMIIAFSLLFGTIETSLADASLEAVKTTGKMKVGFCAQYPPFESKNETTGQFEGFDVDLGKALARELGVEAVFVDAEWQGLLAGLKKGDFDMLITCMSKSETRGENVNFSDVYYELPDVIVVRKDEQAISSRDDLRGKTVGVQVGSGSEQLADSMQEHFGEIKRYNYNPEAFTDLKFNRLDAVLVGYAYAVQQMKTDPSFKVVGEPLAKAEIVIVLPLGADTLTDQVNQALVRIKENGTYEQIHDTWLKVQ
ncbi:ABC transporter substrate-binding protein [Desulfofustis glycolicus]|uniref:Amino acid ABC transporter substrate-binding protein, PAAT family n=1 Tax=Desulfofustis glycolicus DSM 9705 TaxID=1121409 RepID=A0A1M5S113_9BACT|nr:ABC transporter substrate-binding protein [Desulfofustis glycolicus]MCB2216284.1 ABC transporter substrate-binding protein [Desulfobulbaceae bacterium]SHH32018.1 amino acid ABC transporter substrate-binding protein, PAAT family [Desulfofustis glycolicus DSM 9705]